MSTSSDREIEKVLSTFQGIALEEMDKVALMTRRDTKFVLDASTLKMLLAAVSTDYWVLEIGGKRNFDYQSIYLDDENFSAFYAHHRGKLPRNKWRFRTYVDSHTSFFEVKHKKSNGLTVKRRIQVENTKMTVAVEDFIREYGADSSCLQPVVDIDYKRITLVNKRINERITIDTELRIGNALTEQHFGQLAIVEVKREQRLQHSLALDWLKQQHVRPGSLSKYCFALAVLHPELKQNLFKPKKTSMLKRAVAVI